LTKKAKPTAKKAKSQQDRWTPFGRKDCPNGSTAKPLGTGKYMTDKTTIIVSWLLLGLFILLYVWSREAAMVIGFIAYYLRWEDVRKAEKSMKTTKSIYWIGLGIYWVILAGVFASLKLSGNLTVEDYKRHEELSLFALLFLPIVPRMIRHDYYKFKEINATSD
jgi:hypothetical protein